MGNLKPIDYRIIAELIKNPRLSDRQLSRILKVSQPTVTRRRSDIEKEGLLEYSGLPNLDKLGFEIVALVFGKRDYQKYPESIIQKAIDFAKGHPSLIFASPGIGLGYDVMSVSIHKDYSDYAAFMEEMRREAGETMEVNTFLINLHSKEIVERFSLKRFAEKLSKEKET